MCLWGEVRGSLGQTGNVKSCCFSSVFSCLLQVASALWKALTVLYPLLIWNLSLIVLCGSAVNWELVTYEYRKASVWSQCACSGHCFEALWKEVTRLPLSILMSSHSLEASSCQILALDSWPVNVRRENLTLFFPCGFALQEALVLTGYP